ncbi:hypothetical protein [Maridesulfovibrio sp.]|uniref:hypothetical protein n=1 Tax=Maridesulfovibrio sp. TaxID=2795000 RepID=UPI0029F5A7EA|nr:hypothetical protein [Maridesulfovibrio sp.]
MGKKRSFVKYFFWESRLIGCLLLVFVPVALLLSDWSKFEWTKEILTASWNIFEPIVGTLTLAVAVVLYVAEKRESWEESLEKVLTAEFKCVKSKSMLMEARRIPVAGEHDLRAWGQQLGAQILYGDRSLQYFKVERRDEVAKDGSCKEYILTFYLERVPEILEPVHEKNDYVVLKETQDGFKRVYNSSGEEFMKPKKKKSPEGELMNQKIFVKEGKLIS